MLAAGGLQLGQTWFKVAAEFDSTCDAESKFNSCTVRLVKKCSSYLVEVRGNCSCVCACMNSGIGFSEAEGISRTLNMALYNLKKYCQMQVMASVGQFP